MADILIVNRYGVFHVVPERLLGTVQRQGGRRATEEEAIAFEAGFTSLGGGKAVTVAPHEQALAAPWADYDSLNAEQIAARLRAMPPEQIAAVQTYEAAGKARKTILDATTAALSKPEA